KEEDPESPRVLRHVELIDDEAAEYGIKIVRMKDRLMAKKYGYRNPPGITYFRKGKNINYDGDIDDEEEILDWLTNPENMELTDHIERINKKMFQKIRQTTDYLAVFFYKLNCHICDEILEGLEKIDDECDVFGIHLVKIQDPQLAKRYSIKTFPALVYFRNGNPLLFEDDEDCPECDEIMEALEKIDGEADLFGIDFVKVLSTEAAEKFAILNVPSLVYFRKKTPLIYDGDLTQEDKILQWLTSQDVFEIKNEIEEVNKKMLDKLLDENEFLAVFFYEHDNKECEEVSEKLENIDGETDNLDITFVKMADPRYARKWGVTKLPAIVYFRKRFPSIYRGNLHNEQDVLEWLRKNRYRQPELNIYMYMLIAITVLFAMYTGFLLSCFRSEPATPASHPKQA
ncbi:unnamed protein product, partial [Heterotrigona itama]